MATRSAEGRIRKERERSVSFSSDHHEDIFEPGEIDRGRDLRLSIQRADFEFLHRADKQA